MKAKNIHNDSENEREVHFTSPDCRFAILSPSDGEKELWEACFADDPRRGLVIEGRCFRFISCAFNSKNLKEWSTK